MTTEMNKTSEEIRELVKALRAQGKKNYGLYAKVADALEALVAERDQLLIDLNEYQLEVEQLEGKVEQLMEEAQEAEE